MTLYKSLGKRAGDLIVATIGFIALSPLLLILSIAIKLNSPGPIFYKQKRLGKNFKTFYLLKFRSMIVDADKKGLQITTKNDSRITPIGKFLRKTKLDELPQLLNVIKGDISLIGPRPEVEKYILLFKKDYEEILSIKPGITDLAAIKYRHEESILEKYDSKETAYIDIIMPEKISLYKQYLKDISLKTDIRIFFQTLKCIMQ